MSRTAGGGAERSAALKRVLAAGMRRRRRRSVRLDSETGAFIEAFLIPHHDGFTPPTMTGSPPPPHQLLLCTRI